MAKFAGDKKKGQSIFGPLEKKLVEKYVDKVPKWLETYHLTFLTIPWCVLIVLGGYLAQDNLSWLWLVSVMIVFQYVTDLFDGAVGRHRNTGLVKWGYYMDHLLDYFFLCSILICYAFVVLFEFSYYLFFILAILGGFMVNSFLSFSATNQFQISHMGIGPTEIRIVFIIINTLFIIFGKTYLFFTLPFCLAATFGGLVYVIYLNHKEIWAIDMKNKHR
ncbi:CDP-alcohol phosphatidyltransferase family protein [Patescibacteria group bacterium]